MRKIVGLWTTYRFDLATSGKKIASAIFSVVTQKQPSASFTYPSGAYPWLANSPERLGLEVGMQRDYG